MEKVEKKVQVEETEEKKEILKVTKEEKKENVSEDYIVMLKSGKNISYRIYGDKNGTPLLYFHGMFGSRFENYFDFDTFGVKYKQKVYIMDRFGYGNTDQISEPNLKKFSEAIIEFVDKLDIQRFNMIGYSNGGMIALALMYYFPQRLGNILVIAAATPETQIEVSGNVKMMEFFSKHSQWVVKLICYFSSSLLTSQPEKWVDFMMSEEGDLGKKLMKENYDLIKKNYSIGISKYEAVSHDFLVSGNNWGFRATDIDMKKIKGKLYVISGDKDKLEPVKNVENLASQLNGSNFVVYKDYSHFLFSKDNCDDMMKRVSETIKDSLEDEIKL